MTDSNKPDYFSLYDSVLTKWQDMHIEVADLLGKVAGDIQARSPANMSEKCNECKRWRLAVNSACDDLYRKQKEYEAQLKDVMEQAHRIAERSGA